MTNDHPSKLCHPGECRDCEARRARATEQLLDEHAEALSSVIVVAPAGQGPIDYARQHTAERQQRAEGRHTVDTITSDELDRLYERVETYRAAWHSARQRARGRAAAEAALARVRAYATHLFNHGNTRHAQDGLHVLALIANQPEHALLDDRGELRADLEEPKENGERP